MDMDETFKQLHAGPEMLILPNAWDAGSARLFAEAGARAIATTSSGVAWSLGCRDGAHLPVEQYAGLIRNIVRVVDLPVSADVEGGYAADPAGVGETVARIVDAGAVGINLEDGTADPDLTCRKIEAAKAAGMRAGIDLFVNARTDVWLKALAPGREVGESLDRGRLYAGAGADGLFVPGLVDPDGIAAILAGTGLPVNIMARPGLPPLAELSRMGVRRFSAGGAIAQAVLGRARALAAALLQGDMTRLFADSIPYPEMNALFPKGSRGD